MRKMKFLEINYHVEDDETRCSSDYSTMISMEDLNIDKEDLKSKKNEDYFKAIALRLARLNGHTWKYAEVRIQKLNIVQYKIEEDKDGIKTLED